MTGAPGYSGTPLWKKLGLADGLDAVVIKAPEDYHALIAGGPVPRWHAGLVRGVGFIHLFATQAAEITTALPCLIGSMAPDGMIWISWPKRQSRVPTDITEDRIREMCLPLGLIDVKVCAVTDVWSGLKLMIRKELR